MLSGRLPILETVRVCRALAEPTAVAGKVTVPGRICRNAESCPAPCKETIDGVLFAELLIVTVPKRVPARVGVKVTVTVQEPPPATVLPQVLVWAKSPVICTLLTVSVVLPKFLTVKVCGVSGTPIGRLLNASELGAVKTVEALVGEIFAMNWPA